MNIFNAEAHTKREKYLRRAFYMSNISELELQNLRHLIGGCENNQCKMTEYASQASDQSVKQFFQTSAQSAGETKQKLMQFLN